MLVTLEKNEMSELEVTFMSSLQTDLMRASSFTHRSFLNSDIQTILSRPLLTHLSVYLNVSKRGGSNTHKWYLYLF